MLVEVQALVDQSTIGNPRRVTLGLEGNRLNMLLAVLHRHGGISLGDQDVFANAVCGMRIQEPAAALPLLMAALSRLRSRPVPRARVGFGGDGLGGGVGGGRRWCGRLCEAGAQGLQGEKTETEE